MSGMKDAILVINGGSSSIKCSLYDDDSDKKPVATLQISGIGSDTTSLIANSSHGSSSEHTVSSRSFDEAIDILLSVLSETTNSYNLKAIGYRIVHGGPYFNQPVELNAIDSEQWEQLEKLAPDHVPTERRLAERLSSRFTQAVHVACFDTMFTHDLPQDTRYLAIDRKYYDKGIRRYGFHGLSYEYLQQAFEEQAGETAKLGRVIYAHLGSGCSLLSTHNGKPINTTMSFTPTSGVMMSARSGDLDPSIALYLIEHEGMSTDDVRALLNVNSGLRGIAGTPDMKALLANESTDYKSAQAVRMFVNGIKRAIGGLAAELGGVDSLIFSGGIGEQSATLRSRICDDLSYMGITLDPVRNQFGEFLISANDSRTGVHVIPTDENQTIVRHINLFLA
mgnify:CR=1 FL=1